MLTKLRPWLPCIALALAVVVLAVARMARTPTPPSPPLPPPAPAPLALDSAAVLPAPSIEPAKLPDYMANVLRARGMNASLVPCDGRPGFYDLFVSPPDESSAARPLALVEVRPGESAPPVLSVPGDYRVGPYHVVGNPALVTRVREAFPSWGG